MIRTWLIIAILLAPSAAVAADDLTPYERCLQRADKQNDFEMNNCMAGEVKDLDAKLNARYVYLMRAASNPRFKDSLRAAQRAWVVFRDTTCSLEGRRYQENVGSLDRGSELSCTMELTHQRVEWLMHREAD